MENSSWVICERLGSGSHGSVFLGKDPSGLLPDVAVKTAIFSISSSLQKERTILEILNDCPYIIRSFGFDYIIGYDQIYYDLILEYAPGGSLTGLMKERGGKLSELEVKLYIRMILKGLNYVHGKGYVHCDLKPDNILVFPSSKFDGVNRVKIADFGNSKKRGGGSCGPRCTPLYASPESVKYGLNEAPLDIWSLGCVMVELFTGKQPWWGFGHENVDELLFLIGSGSEVPHIPRGFSEDAKDFLRKCLVRDPTRRWTAQMLLSHPFMLDNKPRVPPGFEVRSRLSCFERGSDEVEEDSDPFKMVERRLLKLLMNEAGYLYKPQLMPLSCFKQASKVVQHSATQGLCSSNSVLGSDHFKRLERRLSKLTYEADYLHSILFSRLPD